MAKNSQWFLRGLINNNYYQATPEGETQSRGAPRRICALRITDSGFRWTAESDWRSGDQQQLTTRTLLDEVRSDVEFYAFVESGERFSRTTCSSLGHRSRGPPCVWGWGRRLLIRTSSRSMNGKHDFLSRARDYGKHPEEARRLLAFLWSGGENL